MKQTTSFLAVGLFFLFFSHSVFSQQLHGIRVESDVPVEVFVNGSRVCNAVHSCMIANLRRGDYLVEAFAFSPRSQNSELVFSERVYFSGRGMRDIFVGVEGRYPDVGAYYPMDDDTFRELMSKVQSAAFKSDRQAVIEFAVPHALFTTRQAEQLAQPFAFDDEKLWVLKKIYPALVDKERAFVLVDLLTFSSSKEKLKAFIRNFE